MDVGFLAKAKTASPRSAKIYILATAECKSPYKKAGNVDFLAIDGFALSHRRNLSLEKTKGIENRKKMILQVDI